MMPDPDPQIIAKVENLRKTLHQHNYRYYVLDDPGEISDSQFVRYEHGGSKAISTPYYGGWSVYPYGKQKNRMKFIMPFNTPSACEGALNYNVSYHLNHTVTYGFVLLGKKFDWSKNLNEKKL